MIRKYVHEEIDSEIETISGHYSFHKEVRLTLGERVILYIVGSAVIDRSCCGVGGCCFAVVPGYIVSWKTKSDDHGKVISEVEPISDQSIQQEIIKLIQHREHASQIHFF